MNTLKSTKEIITKYYDQISQKGDWQTIIS